MKNYVLYNPYSNNNKGNVVFEKIKNVISADCEFKDITKISDVDGYLKGISDEDMVIVAGGDGTINNFANSITKVKDNMYFFPCGNGNDFARDVGSLKSLIPLKKYIENLPVCFLNGEERKFINGVGAGLDGHVCAELNDKRMQGNSDADYIKIALKGVLGDYKTTKANVVVDGKKLSFEKVWLCAAMKGRFYGGGFMMAPNQDRLNSDKVSLVVVHNAPIPKILYAFLLVFKGKHTRLKKSVTIIEGYDVSVKFDIPSPLQLDGETYKDILTYEVSSKIKKLQEV